MSKHKKVYYEPPPDGPEHCCGNCFSLGGTCDEYFCLHDPLPEGLDALDDEEPAVDIGGTCDYWKERTHERE